MLTNAKKKRVLFTTLSVFVVIALLFGGCAWYLGDYYRVDEGAIAVFHVDGEVKQQEIEDVGTVFLPSHATAGLIFYPGGKVEHTAYAPLMRTLASQGILCVLVQMPFRLAVLDVNAADGIQECYPEIARWYIGGHSLGGSMAAAYLADHAEQFEGLILLGSYVTADLSDTDLRVLSVWGSEDRVMNRDKYEKNKCNLPTGWKEEVLQGGCHAYFGMYGAQDGDGEPTVTNREQILLTAEHILAMIGEGEG